ncbi:MAG TPA: hypothetical protein DET40_12030 [Lentisphaeria bacterium]|nr:MAG: hypothetical protein A2X45_16775 [Lentisphaerae bacterium GWF2_50_93]HCE44268.1 hypothetical protein [Lentisphaeria bacterium]
MKRVLLGTFSILLFFVLSGCISVEVSETVMPQAQDNPEVVAAVTRLMDELTVTAQTTLDAEKTLAPLSKDKDAVFFFDSKPYTRGELTHFIGKIYGSLKIMSMKWDRKYVKVLGPDAGVWIAIGKGKSIAKTGESYEELLAETWIWQRIDGRWQVVHSHESVISLPNAEKRDKVEKALTQFTLELQNDTPTAENVYGSLEKFLARNPDILGSAYSMNPELGKKASFYLFRNGAKFEQRPTPTSYDYAAADWYAKSVKSGKAEWSEPYYDIDGAGIFMVTCSFPVYGKDKKLIGVITADLGL